MTPYNLIGEVVMKPSALVILGILTLSISGAAIAKNHSQYFQHPNKIDKEQMKIDGFLGRGIMTKKEHRKYSDWLKIRDAASQGYRAFGMETLRDRRDK